MFVSAILLAGGRARVAGRSRATEPGGAGRSAVGAVAEALLRTCVDEVIIVLGKRVAESSPELPTGPRVRIIADPEHVEKERALLRVGLDAAHADATTYLIHRIDGPPLSSAAINRVLAHYLRGGRPIAVLVHGVGIEYPVLVSRRLREELLEPGQGNWLRCLIERDPTRFLVLRVDPRGAVRPVPTLAGRAAAAFRRAPEKAD